MLNPTQSCFPVYLLGWMGTPIFSSGRNEAFIVIDISFGNANTMQHVTNAYGRGKSTSTLIELKCPNSLISFYKTGDPNGEPNFQLAKVFLLKCETMILIISPEVKNKPDGTLGQFCRLNSHAVIPLYISQSRA